jgi:hypothetical protein
VVRVKTTRETTNCMKHTKHKATKKTRRHISMKKLFDVEEKLLKRNLKSDKQTKSKLTRKIAVGVKFLFLF